MKISWERNDRGTDSGGINELSVARLRRVDPHKVPDVISLDRVAGGVSFRGSRRVVVAKTQCSGGDPENVDFTGLNCAIIAQCRGCGSSVFWDSRLKIWTV